MDMYGLRHRGLSKKRACAATSGNIQGSNANGGNSQGTNANGGTSHGTNAGGNSHGSNAVGNSQGTNANGGTSHGTNAGGNSHGSNVVGNSQGTNADGGPANSQMAGDDHINTQLSNGGADDTNDGASGTLQGMNEPPQKRRRRGKRNFTQLRVPPPNGKVMLKPVGSRQFTYMNYNPKDYKYGSQVGVIIKRFYPGMVDIRDEQGRIVEKRAAMSWYDYYCKKDVTGVTYAKLVKCEFWTLFKVTRANVRKADHNLEAYLVKRVSNLIYEARLDAIKFHENCDDNRTRAIHLTEEQYIDSRLSWCSHDAWVFLSKHWTSEEYKTKRKATQASRLNSEDVAQNRGGSRPWGETQQLLEYKFGPEKASTLNTYAVMKSGFKKVDRSGKSAPIPSQRAQTCFDEYNARTQLDENSKELDVQALYFMERGMAHGRVPIADGCVDKQTLAATAKSNRFCSRNTAAYQAALHENEQLKERNDALNETNKKLNENNEILIEENSVNRQMMLRLFEDLNKAPPADLMDRLANIDAHRHQVSASSHVSTHPLEMLCHGNYVDTDDDDDYGEMNDSNSYDDGSDDTSGSEDVDMNSDNGEDSINEEGDNDDIEDDINDY